MSSKDKDALTKIKAFFKGRGAPSKYTYIHKYSQCIRVNNKIITFVQQQTNSPSDIELLEFVLTPEREQELSPRTPIPQRIRSLENLSCELQSKRLEAGSLHKLWELTQDLLNSDRALDQRQAGFKFYQMLIGSQYDNLAEMRVHFFRVIQEHSVPEDINARLALLNTLTNTGKNIKLIDKDIGEFMLHWSQEILEANLIIKYLEIICNMIQFNAACLEKPVVAGIVK